MTSGAETTKVRIPGADLGTRFWPVTKKMPKGTPPVVNHPAMQYVVDEVFNSCLMEMLTISARNKCSQVFTRLDVTSQITSPDAIPALIDLRTRGMSLARPGRLGSIS
jgi:Nucleotidyl transferase